MEYIFPSSHFQSICVLKSEVCFLSQHIYVSCFCFFVCLFVCFYPFSQSVSLVGAFSPFTFKVIIDICVPIAIFLIV